MHKKSVRVLKEYWWFFFFVVLLIIFCWKIILKGYLIGPFDFLVNWYHPYKDIPWESQTLKNAALHFKNYLMSDVVTVVLPVKLLAIDLIKNRQLPLWNPYILNGSPLLANVQSGVLYPLNILYFIFEEKIAFNLYIISQLLLAFIFMFLYLQTLKLSRAASYFGSLAFSFSAFFIVWLSWGTLGHAFLWLPLTLFSIENFFSKRQKKYLFILIISFVFSFFAGHTQTTIVVYGIALAYLIVKITYTRNLALSLPLFFSILMAFLIISVQLFPAIEMYQESVREAVASFDFYKDQTLFFSSYLTAVFPDFFGNPVTRNWWGKINYAESAIYFGTISFYFLTFALLIGKKIKNNLFIFFASLIILGFVLSTQNFFSKWVFNLKIPLISSSTFSRYSIIYIFCGSTLSAFGFEFFITQIKKRKFKLIFLLNLCWIIFFFGFWFIIFVRPPHLFQTHLTIIKRNAILPTLIITATIIIGSSCFFIDRIRGVRNYVIASMIFIFLLSFELSRFAIKYTPFSPFEFFYPRHLLVDTLQRIVGNDRYYGYFPPNINSYYYVRTSEGAEPLYNRRLGELASLGKNGIVSLVDRAAIQFPEGKYKPRILDLLSIKYIVDKTDNYRNFWIKFYDDSFDKRFKEIWTDGIYKIYLNRYALPRQKIYYDVKVISEDNIILKKLISKDFDPLKTVIIKEKTNKKINENGKYKIKIIKDEPLVQEYSLFTTKPGIFLITDTYYPGWVAFDNGKQVKIIRANYAFRAIIVEAGIHKLEFKYQPKSFIFGLILSFFGLLLSVVYLVKIQK